MRARVVLIYLKNSFARIEMIEIQRERRERCWKGPIGVERDSHAASRCARNDISAYLHVAVHSAESKRSLERLRYVPRRASTYAKIIAVQS